MLTSVKVILDKAKLGGYAVPAPNVCNRYTIEAAFEAALENESPVIIDIHVMHGFDDILELVKFYSKKYPEAEVAVSLDHGGPWEDIMGALRAGFTSVMVDRSTLPFEENVEEVKEIVKVAHAMGVSVEAELGHVGQGFEYEATRDSGLTRKEEAVKFVKQTGVDCLAVSVGTSHGNYKGTPKIEFDLLEELNNLLDIPLVLHGGSGTGDENLKKAVEIGMHKINLYTDLSNAGIEAGRNYLINTDHGDLSELDDALKRGYKAKLVHYMKLFGSTGKTK